MLGKGRTRLERLETRGVYGMGICYSGSSGVDRHMAIHGMRYDMIGFAAIKKTGVGSGRLEYGLASCKPLC